MTATEAPAGFPLAPVGTARNGDPFTITVEDVAAYTDATNDRLERYVERNVAPPVYAVVSSASSHIGLLVDIVPTDALLVSVHLGHGMEFLRPVAIGETIASQAKLIETRRSPFGFTLTIEVSVWAESGDVSSICYHRVLFRGLKEGETAGSSPAPLKPPRRAEPQGNARFHVAGDQSLRYARASRDLLPIHTSRDVARRAGFPDLILHGMCTLAMCASTVMDVVAAGDPTRLRSVGATFTRPVIVDRGLQIAVAGRPGEVLHVTATQDGQPVIRDGYATVSEG